MAKGHYGQGQRPGTSLGLIGESGASARVICVGVERSAWGWGLATACKSKRGQKRMTEYGNEGGSPRYISRLNSHLGGRRFWLPFGDGWGSGDLWHVRLCLEWLEWLEWLERMRRCCLWTNWHQVQDSWLQSSSELEQGCKVSTDLDRNLILLIQARGAPSAKKIVARSYFGQKKLTPPISDET